MNSNLEKNLNKILIDLAQISKYTRAEIYESAIKERLSVILTYYNKKLDEAVSHLSNNLPTSIIRRL